VLEPYRIDTCTNNVHEGEHCSVFVVYCKVALGRMIGYEFVSLAAASEVSSFLTYCKGA